MGENVPYGGVVDIIAFKIKFLYLTIVLDLFIIHHFGK